MFDLSFKPLYIGAVAPSDEDLRNGAKSEIVIQVLGGVFLPIAQQGAEQAIPVPAARFAFPLTKEDAKKVGEQLVQAADSLPDKPDIAIASNLGDVAKAAEFEARLRDGRN